MDEHDSKRRVIHLPIPDSAVLAQCVVTTYRSSGSGGQHVNTTDSAVRLKHLPSGIVVTSQVSRSQFKNKQDCLRKLRNEVKKCNYRPKKRIPTKQSVSSVRRRLSSKKNHAQKKQRRGKPTFED